MSAIDILNYNGEAGKLLGISSTNCSSCFEYVKDNASYDYMVDGNKLNNR